MLAMLLRALPPIHNNPHLAQPPTLKPSMPARISGHSTLRMDTVGRS